MITDEHIACFGWASQEEMHDIADMAIRVNDFMCGLFAGHRHPPGRLQARIRPHLGQ
jgi:phosphoribosylaminoimidazole-succinocarboxamide synthase